MGKLHTSILLFSTLLRGGGGNFLKKYLFFSNVSSVLHRIVAAGATVGGLVLAAGATVGGLVLAAGVTVGGLVLSKFAVLRGAYFWGALIIE